MKRNIPGALLVVFALLSAAAGLSGQTPDNVRVYPRTSDSERYDFFADNDHIVPVWISVDFPSLVNLKPSEPMPFRVLVPAGAREQALFSVHATAYGRRSYRMLVSYAKGDPAAVRPDPQALYLFPFEHGTKHRVTQGYRGTFTHRDDNTYALDFDTDIGTPVTAARAGLVVEIKKDSTRGGPHTAYAKDANFILIRHDDGTYGNYVHLRHNGVIVKAGERVEAGRRIGYSGNTGVSSGPHLHFDVRIPRIDGTMDSIPVRFLGPEGEALEPEEGSYYYATHPGKPPFPVIFGDRLTEDDFRDHSQPVRAAGRVDLRFDRIDATYVVYVANGLTVPQEITVDFTLRNLVPSRPEPLTVVVPAGTEHFLLLLRAAPGSAVWGYGYTIRKNPVR